MLTESGLLIARTRLGSFVWDCAANVKGYGFDPVDKAPSTYQEIEEKWVDCRLSKLPYPVWIGGSEKTIYNTPGTNHAGRYWHDYLHVRLGADLSLSGELRVAAEQLRQATAVFGAGSLEVLLLAADTVGQTTHYAKSGMFVEDQLDFAIRYIKELS